jgi:hypothetical protein
MAVSGDGLPQSLLAQVAALLALSTPARRCGRPAQSGLDGLFETRGGAADSASIRRTIGVRHDVVLLDKGVRLDREFGRRDGKDHGEEFVQERVDLGLVGE